MLPGLLTLKHMHLVMAVKTHAKVVDTDALMTPESVVQTILALNGHPMSNFTVLPTTDPVHEEGLDAYRRLARRNDIMFEVTNPELGTVRLTRIDKVLGMAVEERNIRVIRINKVPETKH